MRLFYGSKTPFYCSLGGHWISKKETGQDHMGRITCLKHSKPVRVKLMESRRKRQLVERERRKREREN